MRLSWSPERFVNCYIVAMASAASNSPLLAANISHAVIGAFFDTYNDLGPGFPEFVARRALAIAVRETGLHVHEEIELPVWFRVLHYLKATDLEVGLLVNFGREPQFRRVVYQNSRKRRYFEPPSAAELKQGFPGPEPDVS